MASIIEKGSEKHNAHIEGLKAVVADKKSEKSHVAAAKANLEQHEEKESVKMPERKEKE